MDEPRKMRRSERRIDDIAEMIENPPGCRIRASRACGRRASLSCRPELWFYRRRQPDYALFPLCAGGAQARLHQKKSCRLFHGGKRRQGGFRRTGKL